MITWKRNLMQSNDYRTLPGTGVDFYGLVVTEACNELYYQNSMKFDQNTTAALVV
jgi:hypothetical protein